MALVLVIVVNDVYFWHDLWVLWIPFKTTIKSLTSKVPYAEPACFKFSHYVAVLTLNTPFFLHELMMYCKKEMSTVMALAVWQVELHFLVLMFNVIYVRLTYRSWTSDETSENCPDSLSSHALQPAQENAGKVTYYVLTWFFLLLWFPIT